MCARAFAIAVQGGTVVKALTGGGIIETQAFGVFLTICLAVSWIAGGERVGVSHDSARHRQRLTSKGADQSDFLKRIGVFSDVVAHIKSEYVEEPDIKVSRWVL